MSGRWVGRVFGLVFVVGAGLTTGCSSMNNTEKGALGGGAIGAGVGTVIGAATGNPRTGAAVGTAIGAGVGALAGNDMDREDKARKDAVRLAEAQAAANQAKPLGMIDVVQMANSNPPIGDDVIINSIRQSHAGFQLSPTDIAYLKQNNVSDRVIVEMQNSAGRVAIGPPGTVVVREPTTVIYDRPYYRPYYYYPPPPVGFGVVIRR